MRESVPTSLTIEAVESIDYHFLNCFRATYLVAPSPDNSLDAPSRSRDGRNEYKRWQKLDSMGSSSFLGCVDAEEQALWQPSIDAGMALETGDINDRDLRIWFDPFSRRLLVLRYSN